MWRERAGEIKKNINRVIWLLLLGDYLWIARCWDVTCFDYNLFDGYKCKVKFTFVLTVDVTRNGETIERCTREEREKKKQRTGRRPVECTRNHVKKSVRWKKQSLTSSVWVPVMTMMMMMLMMMSLSVWVRVGGSENIVSCCICFHAVGLTFFLFRYYFLNIFCLFPFLLQQ